MNLEKTNEIEQDGEITTESKVGAIFMESLSGILDDDNKFMIEEKKIFDLVKNLLEEILKNRDGGVGLVDNPSLKDKINAALLSRDVVIPGLVKEHDDLVEEMRKISPINVADYRDFVKQLSVSRFRIVDEVGNFGEAISSLRV